VADANMRRKKQQPWKREVGITLKVWLLCLRGSPPVLAFFFF